MIKCVSLEELKPSILPWTELLIPSESSTITMKAGMQEDNIQVPTSLGPNLTILNLIQTSLDPIMLMELPMV